MYRNTTKEWYEIHFNGEFVLATAEHPFYVDGEWLTAKELLPGMTLSGLNALDVKIDKIRILQLETAEITYNLEVAGNHNYYAGKNAILVHNRCEGADYVSDLSGVKGRSRSSHRRAGNKQLAEAMKKDQNIMNSITNKYGSDAYERVSRGLNPRGAQWHHDHYVKNDLNLVDKKTHLEVHREHGKIGGFELFHNNK